MGIAFFAQMAEEGGGGGAQGGMTALVCLFVTLLVFGYGDM